MFDIICHRGNAHQNPFTSTSMAPVKETDNNDRWQGCKKPEPSYVTDGNVNGAVTLEGSLTVAQNVKHSYHMTQQFLAWVYTRERSKQKSAWKTTRERSELRYSRSQRVKRPKCLLTDE